MCRPLQPLTLLLVLCVAKVPRVDEPRRGDVDVPAYVLTRNFTMRHDCRYDEELLFLDELRCTAALREKRTTSSIHIYVMPQLALLSPSDPFAIKVAASGKYVE